MCYRKLGHVTGNTSLTCTAPKFTEGSRPHFVASIKTQLFLSDCSVVEWARPRVRGMLPITVYTVESVLARLGGVLMGIALRTSLAASAALRTLAETLVFGTSEGIWQIWSNTKFDITGLGGPKRTLEPKVLQVPALAHEVVEGGLVSSTCSSSGDSICRDCLGDNRCGGSGHGDSSPGDKSPGDSSRGDRSGGDRSHGYQCHGDRRSGHGWGTDHTSSSGSGNKNRTNIVTSSGFSTKHGGSQ
ncbi:uncharacterized protein [Dermacentor albipictus]|uniref:uncharacterized protein n=1 Tax=Dermacentor albipictus TaxID=60249 RepID=UPI0038FD13C5